jgi:exopolysaccharide biosynthesis polyprenyl glycosylphosphotransferase
MSVSPHIDDGLVQDSVLAPPSPLPAPAQELAETGGSAAGTKLGIDQARLVAELGRAALIWFTLLVLYAGRHPVSGDDLLTITCAAAIWLATARSVAFACPVTPVHGVRSALGAVLGFAIVGALDNMTSTFNVPLETGLLFAAGVFGSVLVWDRVSENVLAGRRRVLVVGSSGVDDLVADELTDSRNAHFDLVGAVSVPEELTAVVAAQRPDIVVLTDVGTYDDAIDGLLDAHANVRVASLPSFFDYAFGRVPIDQITPAWFMSMLHPRQHIYARFTKRVFDVFVALIGLVLAAPVLAVLAIATKLSDGGPVLYRQTRMGEHGRRFRIYKLRSMRLDAEAEGAAFAAADDPRTTRLGCFLRRTHLDEIPQLWNVLRGDMSIVGPRPERPEFIARLEDAVPFWNRRLLVKPGVTGWAQVRCGYASDTEAMKTKLSYDLWYLRHQSLLLDLVVCALTFSSLFGRQPAKS